MKLLSPSPQKCRSCPAAVGATLLLLAVIRPDAAFAQASSTRVGVVAGMVQNEQLWKPDAETEAVNGVVLGGFANAQTPLSALSVLVEGLYVQRGGNVRTDPDGETITGGVRSDYLTFTLHARLAAGLGRARIHLSGGMTIDQLLRSRIDPSLRSVLDSESPTVFGVSAAAGIGARVTERVHVELEARIVEGLGDAHSGSFVSFRNRSKEIVMRVGIPLPGR